MPKELRNEIQRAGIEIWDGPELNSIAAMEVVEETEMELKGNILYRQRENEFIAEEIRRIKEGRRSEFTLKPETDSLWYHGRICVPDIQEIKSIILKEAHETPYSIHPGSTKMNRDLKKTFWWNNMKREIARYVAECNTCRQVKAEHQSPAGLLQPLPIPKWKWEEISMDFITGLPRTRRNKDSIWVIVDRLTKFSHFIAINQKDNAAQLVDLYVKEIVSKHGVPQSIVSDRGSIFTAAFWRQLHKQLGSNLKYSTAYHPQTGGQTERTNQILEDMLRACALDFGGSWDEHLALA